MKFCSCGAFLMLEGETYVCYKCGHTELATEYTPKKEIKMMFKFSSKEKIKTPKRGLLLRVRNALIEKPRLIWFLLVWVEAKWLLDILVRNVVMLGDDR